MPRLLAIALTLAAAQLNAAPKPNVVFILADDLGYGDIACYGCPDAKTPNIDKLAADGVKFTEFYANGAECTPTRTSIMTGRYPQRAGGLECAIGTGNVGRYDDAIRLAEKSQLGLPPEQCVLPKVFVDNGYTAGIFGKWHLGYEPHFNPLKYGWGEFFGCLGGNVDYFTHKELSPLPALYQNEKPVEAEGYMTHLITDRALAFIETHKAKPFFCYVPYTSPHFPFQAPGDEEKVFTAENWTEGTRESYVAMLEDLDDAVGKLVAKIDALGLRENTLILFASDHGAMKPGLNLPWNGYKGGLFEGGIRAPLVARWPGEIKPGTVCDQVGATFDLAASFARIAGADTSKLELDGIDLLRVAESGTPAAPRPLFWRARRGDRTWRAVRDGDMKFISKTEGGETEQWLFDLAEDPGEKENLLGTRAGAEKRLKSALSAWEDEVKPLR